MSRLGKFFEGVGFRTAHPAFEPGEEVTVIITGLDGDAALVRVGDTILRVEDAPASALNAKARIRISSFDATTHTGDAELLSVVGDGTF